ncbi:hypothetical protein F5B21DRAFT_503932 [Xylaria acuta]|nr:hypothetical protein F5B21DRAFT_503932 [Xylaria acuta]
MGDVESCNITITDQADIESGSLSSCADDETLAISIRNATGVLNFTALTTASLIDVAYSPQLQILDFPHLKSLQFLTANEATNLSSILLRRLSSPAPEIYPNGDYSLGAVYINITGSPSLTDLDVQDAAGLHGLALREVPGLSNPNITSVVILESSSCLNLPALRSVRNLHLTGSNVENCFVLVKLSSVLNFTLTSIGPSEVTFGQTALSVTDTLVLESSVIDASASHFNTLEVGPVASVGSNAFVTSNANVHINFDNLNSVKGNLSINNNQNCTFNFDHLGEVDSLLLMDNPNTPLPSFPSLLRANNIHLRGYIDAANIFPALVTVSNTVTIEAWNDDFNCSKLVSQYQEGTIHKLSCNGTDNVTQTTGGGPPSSPSTPASENGLTQGAKAGIGVGVTVSVLGAAIAIIWLILRFNIQRKGLSHRGSTPPPVEIRDAAATIRESGGQGNIQEKEGNQAHEVEGQMPIHQVEGRMIVQENPGDEIYELPSAYTELHGNSMRRTKKGVQ